ncbi:hypothetical protein B0H13DRAFT_2336650 [Mycena leptocephala]|nr:hypothetical protein B0H13DRAFT_2336650 [Mycena leptocephala]
MLAGIAALAPSHLPHHPPADPPSGTSPSPPRALIPCRRPALVPNARARDRARGQKHRRPARDLPRPRRRLSCALRRPPAPLPRVLGVAAGAPTDAPLPAGVRHPAHLHVHAPPRPRACRAPPLPPAFLLSLEHAPGTQDAAHTTILASLASGTAPHPRLHAISAGSAPMGHAGHVEELWQDMVTRGCGMHWIWG